MARRSTYRPTVRIRYRWADIAALVGACIALVAMLVWAWSLIEPLPSSEPSSSSVDVVAPVTEPEPELSQSGTPEPEPEPVAAATPAPVPAPVDVDAGARPAPGQPTDEPTSDLSQSGTATEPRPAPAPLVTDRLQGEPAGPMLDYERDTLECGATARPAVDVDAHGNWWAYCEPGLID